MKIGIITIHNSPNYGACLQCFALWKFLCKDKNNVVEVIDLYRPIANADYKYSIKYIPIRYESLPFFRRYIYIIRMLLGLNRKIQSRLYNDNSLNKFKLFNSQITLSKSFNSIKKLYKNVPQYDIYIAGSDQLWNPTQAYCNEPYFLTFVPKCYRYKKVSYATSIGVSDLLDVEKIKYKKWLEDFDFISVREKQAQRYLSSFVDKKIERVCDPTFLLNFEDWQEISITPTLSFSYVLVFTLSFNKAIVEYGLKLSKEANKQLVVLSQISPDVMDVSYILVSDAGPAEFIGYIGAADLVITDSFHCTVFALIMGAGNIFTYISPHNKRGSRIIDLLDTFELQDHLLNVELNQSYKDLMSHKINRAKILEIYKNEQKIGQEYLNICLK